MNRTKRELTEEYVMHTAALTLDEILELQKTNLELFKKWNEKNNTDVNEEDDDSEEDDNHDDSEEEDDNPYSNKNIRKRAIAYMMQNMGKYQEIERKQKQRKLELVTGNESTGVYYRVKFSLPAHGFNRVLIVSVQNTSLYHLHELLMKSFSWDDAHLHMFRTSRGKFSNRELCETGKEESACRLDSVLNDKERSIGYVYDFSSEWSISISLEKILTESEMKIEAEKLKIDLPTDLKFVAFCCGGLGGNIDEESGKKSGQFDLEKENKKNLNVWIRE